MIAPDQRVHMLQAETQQLAAFLDTLAPEDWQRSSPCDQWTVADIVAHLTAQAQDYAPRIVRALHGEATAAPEDAPPLAGVRAGSVQAEADTAHRARSLRASLGHALLPTFLAAHRALDETVALIGPEDWHRLCYRPQGNESIQQIVDAFITDRTVHAWDIRSVFDPQARLSPACLPIAVERIAHRPRWQPPLGDAAPVAPPIRARFEVTGEPHYQTDVILTDAHPYMEVVGTAPADVTFRCDGETFVLLMYGRIRAPEAIAQGKMTYAGDFECAVAFGQRFTGG